MFPLKEWMSNDELIEADTELVVNPPRGVCAVAQECTVVRKHKHSIQNSLQK